MRELDVLLPFPDVERNFDANYQVWGGGILLCQGDGEYVQYAIPHQCRDTAKGVSVKNAPGPTLVSNGVAQVKFAWNGHEFEPGELVPCPGARADAYPHCGACSLGCLLKVMMADPELFRMGYYQISTGSKRNYDTIMGTLEMVPAERLNGLEFKLRMVEEPTTYVDKDGSRKKGKKWFLQLEPDPVKTREAYRRAIAGPPPAPALPEPAPEEWDDVDDPLPPPVALAQEPDEEVVVEGEVTPAAEGKGLTKAEADELYRHGMSLILSSTEIMKVLGIEEWSDWTGTYADAKKALDAYTAQ